jgi:hypothetical protein
MNKIASSKLMSTLQRVLLAVLVVMVVLGSAPVSKARAWTYNASTGRPGSVIVPTIYVGDLLMPWGLRQFTLYGSTGPLVYRSPATTGAQAVAARYVVEKWNGYAWVMTTQTGMLSGTIAAGQTAPYRFAAPYIQPVATRGYFRVSYIFAWSANGVGLGGTKVIGNLTSDHGCVTPYRLCQSYAGYFRTGGMGTGAW